MTEAFLPLTESEAAALARYRRRRPWNLAVESTVIAALAAVALVTFTFEVTSDERRA